MLALLVLFQPHRHSSSSSSISSASSSSSFVSFLLRSASLSSLALVLAHREPLPPLLRFDYLRSPRRYPLALVLGHCLLLGPFTPFPLVLEAMHLRRTLTPSLRLASCSVGERTLTSSSRPVPSRHCLLRLVPLLLFLPLLTPPGINQPRCVPFRSRPSSKHLDRLCAEKLIGGPRKRACAPKRCALRTNQRILEESITEKKLPRDDGE